jgi:phytoene desaturase
VANVVVIGAGMGGLAVAARLATLGHDVTICEQAATVGGKVGSFSRQGFTFDTGPSLLTLPAVYRDLFIKTGEPLEEVVDLVEVEPAWRYRFGGNDGAPAWLDVPNASRAGTRRAFDETLGPGTGAAWDRLLDHGQAVWQVTREPVLESPLNGRRDLVRLARRPRDVRTVAPWLTLRQLGGRYLDDARQRMLLDRYATYAGSDPRRAPAALVTIPYVEQTFGSWYVRGGLRRLLDAVHVRATERGVKVRTSCDVAEVVVEGGRACAVRLSTGERLAADVVISNVDASELYDGLVSDGAARGVRARLQRATPSMSAFVLMLALRGRSLDVAHHTVLFPTDYDAEFDHIFGRSPQPVSDPAIYIAAADDPVLRPDGNSEGWFVSVNAPLHGDVDWSPADEAEQYAEKVLAIMAARGVEVRHRLLWKEVRTPADLERDTRARGGAIYGTSSNGVSAAFLRPANRSPVRGLFLVGGSAHPGGGLPLVGMSAAIVANLVGPA